MSHTNTGGFCGGDEVSAIVLDTGTSSTRCGYAGDDHPKASIPSLVAVGEASSMDIDAGNAKGEDGSVTKRRMRPGHSCFGNLGGTLGGAGTAGVRPGDELVAPMVHSLPHHPEALESLWDHVLHDVLRCDPTEYAVLLSEASHAMKRRGAASGPGSITGSSMRAEICEILYEGQGVPGLYIARAATLAAFAAYRGTALVVDVGGGGISATAVHDGFVLGGAGRNIPRNDWGGEDISDLLNQVVGGMASSNAMPSESIAAVGLRPRYEIKRTLRDARSVVSAERDAAQAEEKAGRAGGSGGPGGIGGGGPMGGGASSSSSSALPPPSSGNGAPLPARLYDVRYTDMPGVTSSARAHHIRALADDIKRDLCHISPTPLGPASGGRGGSLVPASAEAAREPGAYELPDGSVLRLGQAARAVPEVLFNPAAANGLLPNGGPWEHAAGSTAVQDLVQQAIDQCDVDIRRELYGNIVVTGGVARTKGFSERLLTEMYGTAPQNFATRIKLVNVHQFAPQVTSHTWLGGSILSSLGSFQQEWISKQEYEEGGVGAVDRKCP